jgi:hypothetical protein
VCLEAIVLPKCDHVSIQDLKRNRSVDERRLKVKAKVVPVHVMKACRGE